MILSYKKWEKDMTCKPDRQSNYSLWHSSKYEIILLRKECYWKVVLAATMLWDHWRLLPKVISTFLYLQFHDTPYILFPFAGGQKKQIKTWILLYLIYFSKVCVDLYSFYKNETCVFQSKNVSWRRRAFAKILLR